MTEQLTAPSIDKSTWGPGAWQDEPDRVDFMHAGFACFALRHEENGHWCGYVGVPREHPFYGKEHGEVSSDLDGHRGVNYSAPCDGGRICHVPEPGMPDDVWWFGFDCGHAFDLSPGIAARMRELHANMSAAGHPRADAFDRKHDFMEVYRALPYVRREIERLAEQLAAL
jgi:hypothetical protein